MRVLMGRAMHGLRAHLIATGPALDLQLAYTRDRTHGELGEPG